MSKYSEAVMRAQRRKKQFAVEQFGGKCCKCGYNKCLNSLTFHHVEDKRFEASYVVHRWSWERARKELEKCILVCANCHGEIHFKEFDSSLKQYLKPWVDKSCGACKKSFSTRQEDQIFCSPECATFASRRTKWPTKRELKKLLDNKVPWTKIGNIFGVSDNAVRKWARNYKLLDRKH